MKDLELFKQYIENRSEQAFSELVERYYDMVFSVCRRRIGDLGLAQDATQGVFLTLSKNPGRVRKGMLSGWLIRAAQYASLHTIRTEKRRRKHEKEAGHMRLQKSTPESEWALVEPVLDDALLSLNEKDRSAVILRYFRNEPYIDIGSTLGISDDAAQKRVSRAIKKLKKFCTRKGITLSVEGLIGLITANAVEAAPAGSVEECSSAILGKTGGGIAVSSNVNSIAKGVMNMMIRAKVKVAAAVLLTAVVMGTGGISAVLAVGGETTADKTDKNGFLPAGVLLIGSGVSPRFKNPAMEKIEARYKKEGKPSPFPRVYPQPRPGFVYNAHRSPKHVDSFKPNVEFLAKEIVPYAPGDVYAGCAEMREGSHGKGMCWRCEDGPKDKPMTYFMNIHSMKRQSAFLKSKGIKFGLHLGVVQAPLSQLPPNALKKGIILKPDKGLQGRLPKGVEPGRLNPKSPEAVKWVENTFDHLSNEIGLRYMWYDWGADPELVGAAKRGATKKGAKFVMRGVVPYGGKGLLEQADVIAPGPDLECYWGCYEFRVRYWFPEFYPRYYKHIGRIGVDDFYVRSPFTRDQARFSASAWGLLGCEITETEGDFYTTPKHRLRILQSILPLPNTEPLDFTSKGAPDARRQTAQPVATRKSGKKRVEGPRAWIVFHSQPFEKWHVVGFFNPEPFNVEKSLLELKHLQLKEADYSGWKNWKGDYVAWDFWDQRFLGVFSKKMKVRLAPASCLVLAVRRRTGGPQMLSTDRHITQGSMELKDWKWSEQTGKLTGSFKRGVAGRSFSVFIYVPRNYAYQSSSGDVLKVEKAGGQVLRVTLKPQVKAGFELSFRKTGNKAPDVKPADGKLVQNTLAELVSGSTLEFKEIWIKPGAHNADFLKETPDSPGWTRHKRVFPPDPKVKKQSTWLMARAVIPASAKGHDLRVWSAYEGIYVRGINGKPFKGRIQSVLDPAAIRYGEENTFMLYSQRGPKSVARGVGLKIDLCEGE